MGTRVYDYNYFYNYYSHYIGRVFYYFLRDLDRFSDYERNLFKYILQ